MPVFQTLKSSRWIIVADGVGFLIALTLLCFESAALPGYWWIAFPVLMAAFIACVYSKFLDLRGTAPPPEPTTRTHSQIKLIILESEAIAGNDACEHHTDNSRQNETSRSIVRR